MELKLISEIKDVCKEIITALPMLNNTERREIRGIILQLKKDLTDSLVLAEQYLSGVERAKRESDLIDLLQNAPPRLLETYNEFKICAALYHLHDRFGQWFSAVSGAINVKNIQTVKCLIGRIADGERYIIRELEDVIRELPTFAYQLEHALPTDKDAVRENMCSFIRMSLATLRKAEREIRASINGAIKLM